MSHILGVDGGGSKTLAVLGDVTGTILGVGRAGGSNYQGPGIEAAMREIRRAVEDAMRMTQAMHPQLDTASFCLAGADLPEDFELLRPALIELGLTGTIDLHNDMMANLRAGSDNPNAVVVGWGSGTNAMGRNAAGREIRLPALGWYSGDWGGGDDLARDAIWLVARAHDGRGRSTALTEPVLRILGVPTADAMIHTLYVQHVHQRELDWRTLRMLPPIVLQVAADGDPEARALIERAADEVSASATALLCRLDLLAVSADVVLGGSVFRGPGAFLVDLVRPRLSERAPLARIIVPDVEPVIGAFFCALDACSAPVTAEVRARARSSYERLATPAAEEVVTP
jgi:N-acetylglucosamine kinase-like BadF-type ATPase